MPQRRRRGPPTTIPTTARCSAVECQYVPVTEDSSDPSPRPGPSVRGQLLATLLSQNTLVQPEVALTRATQFLLALPGAANALDKLIQASGLTPEPGGYWLTEVRGEDGRTDLEYRWGADEAVQVVVEAKVGHTLGSDQVAAYRRRLGEHGLLVVLVPATRQRRDQEVVQELRDRYALAGDQVQVALWTWNDVADALSSALPADQPDAAQLRGLVETAGALDIRPFTAAELLTSDRTRFDDLWSVLDKASFQGFPAQAGGYFERHRKYPVGDFDAYFSVGIGRTDQTEPEGWCWVRILEDVHLGPAQQQAIKTHRPDAVRDGNDLVVPLHLEPDLSGYELIESLREQLNAIAQQVRDGIRKIILDENERTVVRAAEMAPTRLRGIPDFTAAQLLDSDPSRRHDIQLVLDQVCRHIFDGAAVKWAGPDAAFEKRNWIKLEPYRSHLSIGVARKDAAAEPRPWAWLSFETRAPQADIIRRTLDTAFPGQLAQIPKGWALPLAIAPGHNGIEAFGSVVGQIAETKAAIFQALRPQA